MRILGLEGNLGHWIVVHTKGHTLHLGIVIGRILCIAGIRVILLVAAEGIEVRGEGGEVRD